MMTHRSCSFSSPFSSSSSSLSHYSSLSSHPLIQCRPPPEVAECWKRNPAGVVGVVENLAPGEMGVEWMQVPALVRNRPGSNYIVKYRHRTLETEAADWTLVEIRDTDASNGLAWLEPRKTALQLSKLRPPDTRPWPWDCRSKHQQQKRTGIARGPRVRSFLI